jgi:hypothetical protein
MRRAWRYVLMAAIGTLSACGSTANHGNSASTIALATAPVSANAEVQTTPSALITSTPSPTAKVAPVPATVELTFDQGWRFLWHPRLAPIDIVLTKSIENSPPGSAVVAAALSSDYSAIPGDLVSEDIGRTPPELSIRLSALCWYDIPKIVLYGSIQQSDKFYPPVPHPAYCIDFANDGPGYVRSPSADEAAIENAVAAEQPVVATSPDFYVLAINCAGSLGEAGVMNVFADGTGDCSTHLKSAEAL